MTGQPPGLLVVGGSGFIGRHVVERGVERGWRVTSLAVRAAAGLAGAARSLTADLTDRAALQAALAGETFDYVVNCGGYIDHAPLMAGGRATFESHFTGVLNLVQLLDRGTLRSFVNLGSSDEYGGATAPQVEAQREAPISPYSLGKVAATHLIQMLHRTEGFPGVTLRLFLTYGPGQDTRRFLPQIILGCLEGRSFPTSAGEQLRDFCYVRDTVDAIFAALERPASNGEVINVASGRPVAIREVIETVRRLVGQGEPRFGAVPYRAGESMRLYADISKARALLDWEPRVPLEAGIREVIRSMGHPS